MIARKIAYEKLNVGDFTPKQLLFELPKLGVPAVRLKEIAEVNPSTRKFNRNDSSREHYRFVELSTINYQTNEIQPKEITKEQLTPRARFQGKKGDLILPLIQSYDFKGIILQEDNLIISDNFAIINSEHNEYILAITDGDFVKEQVKAYAKGSVISRLSVSDLKEIQLPWHSEEERKKIIDQYKNKMQHQEHDKIGFDVSKVNEVFYQYFKVEKPQENESVIKAVAYDNLSKDSWNISEILSNFDEEIGEIENSKVVPLGAYCHVSMGVNKSKFKDANEQVPIIKGMNIKPFEITGKFKKEEINQEKAIKSGYRLAKEGNILIQVKGKIGAAALVREKDAGLLYNDTVVSIESLNKKALLSEFLELLLNSYLIQEQLKNFTKGTTVPFISLSQINDKMKIIVPTIEVQREIINAIKG